MRIFLVQHAEALSKEQDQERPLSDLGRQHIACVADAAVKLDVKVDQIRHSGKTRARQTAEILAGALAPPDGVVAVSGLSPLDDVEPVAKDLAADAQVVMLVGHLPFIERLAGYLLTGDSEQPVIDFTNAGLVCLEKEDRRWQVSWILTPAIAKVSCQG